MSDLQLLLGQSQPHAFQKPYANFGRTVLEDLTSELSGALAQTAPAHYTIQPRCPLTLRNSTIAGPTADTSTLYLMFVGLNQYKGLLSRTGCAGTCRVTCDEQVLA